LGLAEEVGEEPTMTHPKYWSARHSSKPEDVKRVFKLAEETVARAPPPWKPARRGRPAKFSPRLHAAICITMVCLNLTYREVEAQAPFFMGMSIDHSTVGWAFNRLRENYLKLLILVLRRKLEDEVKPEFFVIDSTGISTPRFTERRIAMKTVRRRVSLKLHAVVGCSLEQSAMIAYSASVTGEGVHDCTQLEPLLSEIWANGEPLLGDPAYDWDFAREFIRAHGFKPIIEPRKHEDGPHGLDRRDALREFEENRELYKLRKVAEGFFGGIENRYGARVRCKLLHLEVYCILLMVVAHNLRTLMRVRAQNKEEFFICFLINSTNPK